MINEDGSNECSQKESETSASVRGYCRAHALGRRGLQRRWTSATGLERVAWRQRTVTWLRPHTAPDSRKSTICSRTRRTVSNGCLSTRPCRARLRCYNTRVYAYSVGVGKWRSELRRCMEYDTDRHSVLALGFCRPISRLIEIVARASASSGQSVRRRNAHRPWVSFSTTKNIEGPKIKKESSVPRLCSECPKSKIYPLRG